MSSFSLALGGLEQNTVKTRKKDEKMFFDTCTKLDDTSVCRETKDRAWGVLWCHEVVLNSADSGCQYMEYIKEAPGAPSSAQSYPFLTLNLFIYLFIIYLFIHLFIHPFLYLFLFNEDQG